LLNSRNERQDTPPVIIGADIGYSYVKVTDGKETFVESSVLGEYRKPFDPFTPEDVRYTGDADGEHKTLFVGALAQRESKLHFASIGDNKAGSWETTVLLKTGIGWLNPFTTVNLVTGLPVDYYHNQKEKFEALLKSFNSGDPYTVTKGYLEKKVNPRINDFLIVPQPLGSLMDYLLDDTGKIVDNKEFMQDILVIDPGFYTLDLLVWSECRSGKDSTTPPGLGISKAYELMQEPLKEQIGRKPSIYDIDYAVRRNCKYQGHDIRPLVNAAFKNLGIQINSEVKQLNRDFHKYIITGGRAAEIAPYIDVPEDKKVIRGWSGNVDGYLKIGKKRWNS
jgi:plasmid segregation protein ParM